MTANYNNRGAAKPVGQPFRLPPRSGTGASGLWGSMLARARSVVSQAVQPCAVGRPGLVDGLDDHLLLDIGLTVDAVRRDIRRGPWPH
jgi:hypothetical protein